MGSHALYAMLSGMVTNLTLKNYQTYLTDFSKSDSAHL